MLEKIIKKDKNEELEKILEQKKVNEQAKNILQGILYKIEISYKDYKKVKAKKQTEEKYVKEILRNISERCNKISVVRLTQKLADESIQKELEKNKYYIGEEIVSYPIEEKILYAIEKKSRYSKILNSKYEELSIAISEFINTGKNIDRIEVLRDFNGWSWTTINKEIENIEANLIYQCLQIILGEKFLEDWCEDKDGIIDYLEQFYEETSKKYGEQIANNQKKYLEEIAMNNVAREQEEFKKEILLKIEKVNNDLEKYENTQEKIIEITERKKQLLLELNQIEKIIGQKSRLKEEYEKRNEELPIDKKIFNIRTFKKQLEDRKKMILEGIEKANYLLNPINFIEEKCKLIEKKQLLQIIQLDQEELEALLVKFIENFLKCFQTLIKKTKDEEDIIKLIYKFRYFMLLPFNSEKSIKDIEKLQKGVMETEKKLVQKAIQKKVISDVPLEIMKHVFETRIIILENLCYKITGKKDEQYVQIFDENISEERFKIKPIEKIKINKKIKIFI